MSTVLIICIQITVHVSFCNLFTRYVPMISRNVSDTMRLVPQLRTVAREMALPLTEAGKISLRISQDTAETINQYS